MNSNKTTYCLTAIDFPPYNQGMNLGKIQIRGFISIMRRIIFLLILLNLSLYPANLALANPARQENTVTPAEVVEAVNDLRQEWELNLLSVHPVLMQVAQIEADGIASGSAGHWRPPGLTLGQWLISLGYPLSGDLTQDGYRSENWIIAKTAKRAIDAWKDSPDHANTMLSPDRSDIGVGIAVSDDVYIVLITALRTASGKMQSNAHLILTQASSSTGEQSGFMPFQYIKPVVLSTARPDGDVIHKVQYGQSLWSIAIAYNTTIDQIRAWNNLGDEITVYENQFLLVQRSATQPPPATNTAAAMPTIAVATESPAPSTDRIYPLHPMMMTPSPTLVNGNTPAGDIPMELRIAIVVILLGLSGFLSLFFFQKVK